MDCKCNKEKHSYHFNVSEVKDGKIREVMDFNFGGHHDIALMAQTIAAKGDISEKHAKELAVAIRLLHHVLKKYPDNELFQSFFAQLNEFKRGLKGNCDC